MAVIPNTSVNLATHVRDVLNADGGSVSNDVTTFFTAGAKINKWAKYKPVSYRKDFNLTDEERKSVYWGISNIPEFRRLGYLFNFVNGNTSSPNIPECGLQPEYFSYSLPSGGSASPYRLEDFCRYDTDAKPPIGEPAFTEFELSTNDTSISVVYTNTYFENGLSLYDIMGPVASNYYVGLAIVNSSGSIMRYITSESKLSSNGNDTLRWVLGNLGQSYVGSYKMFLFLSNNAYTTTQSSVATAEGSFIYLDFTLRNIEIKKNVLDFYVALTAWPSSSDSPSPLAEDTSGNLNYNIFLRNDESYTVTVNKFVLYAYRNGTNYGVIDVPVNTRFAASQQNTYNGTMGINTVSASDINSIKYIVIVDGNAIEGWGTITPTISPI